MNWGKILETRARESKKARDERKIWVVVCWKALLDTTAITNTLPSTPSNRITGEMYNQQMRGRLLE